MTDTTPQTPEDETPVAPEPGADPSTTPAEPAAAATEPAESNAAESARPDEPAPPATPAEPRRTAGLPVVAALAIGALVGGAAGAGVAAWAVSSSLSETQQLESAPGTITVNNPDDVTAVTAIAAKAGPSIVTISAAGRSAGGSGSGVILSSDGYVLTNNHVITLDGVTNDARLEITTADGRIYSAEIVGTDPITDLAVIKLEDASGLTPIEVTSSSDLNVGERTVVIGAPLGLSNSVSDGIVSALNRTIRVASSAVPEEQSDGSDSDAPDFNFNFPGDRGDASSTISIPVIQTDAAVNPGNSGGGLVDGEGKLIGVIVAIASTQSQISGQSGSIGVGFAIPSDLALRVADELIENGVATHGLLGVTVGDASSATGSTLGAVVGDVTPGGAGGAAGIRVDDIVTSLGGLPITSATDLTAQVRALAAGTTTTLGFVRDGQPHEVEVTLGSLE